MKVIDLPPPRPEPARRAKPGGTGQIILDPRVKPKTGAYHSFPFMDEFSVHPSRSQDAFADVVRVLSARISPAERDKLYTRREPFWDIEMSTVGIKTGDKERSHVLLLESPGEFAYFTPLEEGDKLLPHSILKGIVKKHSRVQERSSLREQAMEAGVPNKPLNQSRIMGLFQTH